MIRDRTVRIRYTAYPDTAPEPVVSRLDPVGSRLDPVIEWAAANPWKVAVIIALFAFSAPGIVEWFL